MIPSCIFLPGMESDGLTVGPPHAWLWHGLEDGSGQTWAVSSLSVQSSDDTWKQYGFYASQITLWGCAWTFWTRLDLHSCGQHGSSLGAINQIDRRNLTSLELTLNTAGFILTTGNQCNGVQWIVPVYWSKLSQDAICFIGIFYLCYTSATVLGQELPKGRCLHTGHARSSSLIQVELGVRSPVMIFPFQCHLCIRSSANSCHLINTSRYVHQCSFCFISQGKNQLWIHFLKPFSVSWNLCFTKQK